MAEIRLSCFKCSGELVLLQGFSRREECLHCGADVHVCKNCKFYDRNAYNECLEPSADCVKDKERTNFCDYFQLITGSNPTKSSKDDLVAAAEALFKK